MHLWHEHQKEFVGYAHLKFAESSLPMLDFFFSVASDSCFKLLVPQVLTLNIQKENTQAF